MENRRTFTRIERAFTATTVLGDTSVGSNANNVSESFDQSARAKLPIKLSTKEKIRQMQAMLQQLEHEVAERSDNASEINDWEDSDDGTEKKSNADEINDNKPAADQCRMDTVSKMDSISLLQEELIFLNFLFTRHSNKYVHVHMLLVTFPFPSLLCIICTESSLELY